MESTISDLKIERETTIVFNEAEDAAMIWSASPRFQRAMGKIGVEPYKTAGRERGEQSCWYKVPREWIHVRKPKQRQLSPEQRQNMADRARSMFRKKEGREIQ